MSPPTMIVHTTQAAFIFQQKDNLWSHHLPKQATNYIKENFIGKLDETTLRDMTEWLSTQLEKERTGKKQ